MDDITTVGGLRQKPGGLSYEGKLFATSAEDAARFGRINYRLDAAIGLDNPFHIIAIHVSEALVRYSVLQTLDFMLAVYVAEDGLSLLNRHATMSELPVIPLME